MFKKYLITDIDNTLYDYFSLSTCFRAMIHVLSKETGVGEDVIMNDYSKVFHNRGTVEYPYPTQELDFLQDYPSDKVEYLSELSVKVFSRSYNKRLIAYEGVQETLISLKNNGWTICGVTNAPLYRAFSRLKRTKLLEYFSVLAGRAFEEVNLSKFVTEQHKAAHKEKYLDAVNFMNSKGIKTYTVPSSQIKPNPSLFLKVLEHIELNEGKKDTFKVAIGDNLLNDLLPIKNLVDSLVWAQYGTIIDTKNRETMIKLTKWQNKEREDIIKLTPEEIYTYKISKFKEIEDIYELHKQLELDI